MTQHRSGGKFTGSHTTVTDVSEKVVDEAHNLPEVSKIVLGLIKQKKCKKRRIKCEEIPAGWKVTVCGNVTIQEVYIYTSPEGRGKVRQALERLRL